MCVWMWDRVRVASVGSVWFDLNICMHLRCSSTVLHGAQFVFKWSYVLCVRRNCFGNVCFHLHISTRAFMLLSDAMDKMWRRHITQQHTHTHILVQIGESRPTDACLHVHIHPLIRVVLYTGKTSTPVSQPAVSSHRSTSGYIQPKRAHRSMFLFDFRLGGRRRDEEPIWSRTKYTKIHKIISNCNYNRRARLATTKSVVAHTVVLSPVNKIYSWTHTQFRLLISDFRYPICLCRHAIRRAVSSGFGITPYYYYYY